ncbi:hypothetical protein [Microlunatus speluncae]|uniref:hypothetical protein n=1 Tax=Microlunatus speluncae TaxID=2594267 RepID=UPI001C2D40E9|nr:hypothetical protein [Microlunatus speluncae]
MSTIEGTSSPARDSGPKRVVRAVARRWPAIAGAAVALLTVVPVLRLGTVNDVAAVVTASALVYLGAAALGLRGAAWPVFGVSFVLMTIGFFVPGFNPSWVMIAIAAALLIFGVVRGRWRPTHGLPLQLAALVILGPVALIAAGVDPRVSGVLIAAGLFAHAGWDLYHHRKDRVVVQSMAEFCLVLDTVLAIAVLFLAFR